MTGSAFNVMVTGGAMLLLMAGPIFAQSGGPTPVIGLTLEDTMQLALDRNLDIEVQRIAPQTFDLSIAGLLAAYKPVFTSQLGTQSTVNPSTSTIAGAAAATGISSGVSTFNAGLTSNLPWGGGGLTVTLNNNRQSTTSQTTLFNPAYNTSYSVQYSQPLLKGFAIDNTRSQIRITRINQGMSELQLEATIVNTLSDVKNAYWDLVYAVETVDVARQSVALADKLVADNEGRVQVGTLAPIDVVQARSQAASQQKTLVQADRKALVEFDRLKQTTLQGANVVVVSAS